MSATWIATLPESDRALLAWFEIQALRAERDKRRSVAKAVRAALGLREGEAVR